MDDPAAPDPRAAASDDATVDAPHLLLLGSAVLLLAALYLLPLASFAYFGSDTGEYVRLARDLASSGHLPTGGSYGGWGVGYPDFPGLFVVTAAVSGATGADSLTALSVAIPLLAAGAVAPLFLLFRRIVPNRSVALFGAAFAGVLMPRAFSLAHPAPLALGDLFVVAGLWMFVEGRTDRRWYLPLVLLSGALVLTHHLSSYFLLATAFGGFVLLELLRPGAWSARFPRRELLFLAAFGVALDAYWFGGAPDFATWVIGPAVPSGLSLRAMGWAIGAASVGFPLLVAAVLRWRRAHPGRPLRAKFPSDASVLRDLLLVGLSTFGGISLLLLVPLPGTAHQETTAAAIGFYAPLLVCIPLIAGTRRLSSIPRLGPLALTLLLAVGLSATVGLATQSALLAPVRHAEYLLLPVALLFALALGRWAGRAFDLGGPRAAGAVVAGALLLLAANAALVYPPPSDLGGFQEGLTPRDALLAEWSAGGLPAGTVVASDHRLSSYLFGIDGDRATWGSTPDLFGGSDRSAALGELNGSPAPTDRLAIDAVAIDGVMRAQGVALDPSAPATPLSASAAVWLDGPPFLPVYENQGEVVDWVAGPIS